MGHCWFLLTNHPLRKKCKHFNGKLDNHTKPAYHNGTHLFSMVKDLKLVFGKGLGTKHVLSEDGKAPMWKKKSLF